MSRSVLSGLLFIIVLAIADPAAAATGEARLSSPERLSGDLLFGGPAEAAKSHRDSVVVFGGPGTLEGKFEDVFGNPDRQGWTGVDFTTNDILYWHLSNFHAADLDPETPGNHAWWCGTTYESCGPDDLVEGYGNNWYQTLNWQSKVTDPSAPVSVTVTAVIAWDTEPGYDFLSLEFDGVDGYQTVWQEDGQRAFFEFAETFTVATGDYQGQGGDEVHLRWRFVSDGGWSDEDCLFPSEFGAAQIDLITVSFDQGGGSEQIGPVETAEPGDPSNWIPGTNPGVGDFSNIWTGLDDLDSCFDDSSPLLAFIDDGVVVPGTGGSSCISWCYGPDGYVVNFTGGLAGDDYHVFNVAWSPDIALPGDLATSATLAFDVFEHNGFAIANTAEIFWIWYVQSTADPSGESGWSAPVNDNFLREGGPGWRRMVLEVGDLLVPHARHVRFGLGVRQHRFGWQVGNESTPAPYFDNVRLSLSEPAGPVVTLNTLDMAQDAYPASGVIDPGDLGAAGVRFDTARNTAFGYPALVAGDSIRIRARLIDQEGGSFAEAPRLHYRLFRNSLFDPFRHAGWPDAGYVDGDTINIYQAILDCSFDLPDEDFLFPGDRLHYYITAREERGGTIFTTILPADTTGFANGDPEAAIHGPSYDQRFTFRALPNLRSADLADRPTVLFWDRADRPDARRAWVQSLAQLGLLEGADYDLFASQAPSADEVNSLARLCGDVLLTGYRIIMVDSGHQSITFTGPFLYGGETNPAPDTVALDAWLDLGDRALFVAGDNAPASLAYIDPGFLADRIGGEPAGTGVFEDDLGGQVAPPVLTLDGAPWPQSLPGWIASGCQGNFYNIRGQVESMVPVGGSVRLAGYGTPDHDPGVYPYAALLLNEFPTVGSQVVTLAHSLVRVVTDHDHGAPGSPLPARTLLLAEVLAAFGQGPGSPPVPAPDVPAALDLAAYPNPFNPSVTLALAIPRPGPVEVAVFDLRGRRVRTLVNGRQEAGRLELHWDGADDAGRMQSAGVYLALIRSGGEERTVKIALVK